MSQVNFASIDDELLYFMRNNITDPEGRGSGGTYSTTATAGQTTFTISTAKIKNIKTVTVAGSSKDYGTDYSVSITTTNATVTLTTGANNGDAVVITYHYGNTWIYNDMPRTDITLGSFPRIAITDVNAAMREVALNATLTQMSMLKSITVCALSKKSLNDIITEVKNDMLANKKNFYNFNLIVPVGMGPVLPFNTVITDRGKEIETMQQNMDFEIPFVWEGTS